MAGGSLSEGPRTAGALPPEPAGETLGLHDYGVIGNERTGALISRRGSIDWACLPRFDSPSVFAALLDRRRGGSHRLAPLDRYTSHQQYVAGTNVLTTFFEFRRGLRLTVTDFMPMGPATTAIGRDPRIVRRAVATGGPIRIEIAAHPQFDYGRASPTWEVAGTTAIASNGPDRLALTSPWPWVPDENGLRSVGEVLPGTPAVAQVRWGDPPPSEPSVPALLGVTEAYWRGWVSPPEAPLRRVAARWQPWVERSELVLKLLSYADSGVFVAAPTTSLPEWPGGPRNWDYRFVWIRDAAFTAQVFLLLGHLPEARAYVGWALDRAGELRPGEELRTVYTLDGRSPPPEAELPHLEGYRGSRPVRIGNGAADQRQLDIYGEILDSALLLERVDPAFVRDRWPTIERLAERTTELWTEPDSGIWESRAPPDHFVHSKLMCWVALDRALQLAQAFGETARVDQWRRTADEIRAAILARGFDGRQASFVQAFGRRELDASALRIPLTGFLPPDDPRVLSTLEAVQERLGRGPFLWRYEGDDGVGGPEGAFLLCSFWLVEALAKSGHRDRALERWRSLLEVGSPLLLFSEEHDPATNEPLGNYPQAFTHIGVLRGALALGLVREGG
jgi:GH15 family glucan-1,4-alpha-glucosidase